MPDPIYVVPPELQSKISLWKQRANDGTITIDEMKEAVIAIRQGRRTAAVAAETSVKSTRSKKSPAKSTDELLSELGNL